MPEPSEGAGGVGGMGTVISRLQIGHSFFTRSSQLSISGRWKTCPQGNTRTLSPSTNSDRQMAHSSQL